MTMNDVTPDLPMSDQQLDVCGQKCPMPILRTKKTLAAMRSGEVLAVRVTDPAAREDFAAFARQTGHTLLSVVDAAEHWTIYLRCK